MKLGDEIIGSDTTFEIVDSEQQYLECRVGPVFYENKQERGLWINYQSRYLESDFEGPFLMSETTFKELSMYVRDRFRRSRYPGWLCDIVQRIEWAIADFRTRMDRKSE